MIVYFHRNPTTNEVFYVGIASENGRASRPYKKDNRNKYWNHYVNKHGGFVVDIIHKGLGNEEAFELEKKYISQFGKRINGGLLVNLSDGGESNIGYKQTEEQRKASSARAKRIGTAHMMTKEIRDRATAKMKITLKGLLIGEKNPNYGNKWTREMKNKMSLLKSGKTFTTEQSAIKTYKQLLSTRNFVFDPNLNCTFLSIKYVAEYYNHTPSYIGYMLHGKRPNRYNLQLYPSGTIQPLNPFLV